MSVGSLFGLAFILCLMVIGTSTGAFFITHKNSCQSLINRKFPSLKSLLSG